jgi:hypothetical protein
MQLRNGEASATPLNSWRVSVARTEAGQRAATLDDLLLYAAALGVAPVDLLFGDDGPDEPLRVAARLALPNELAALWFLDVFPLRREDIARFLERDAGSLRLPVPPQEVEIALGAIGRPEPPPDEGAWQNLRARLLATEAGRETLRAHVEAERRALDWKPPASWPEPRRRSAIEEHKEWRVEREAQLGRMEATLDQYEQKLKRRRKR